MPDYDGRFGFDDFVRDLADELELEDGEVDPEKLERRIASGLREMNLSNMEVAAFLTRTRHTLGGRVDRGFSRRAERITERLRREREAGGAGSQP